MTQLPEPNDGQDDPPRPPTLGELLATAGGRLRDRHLPLIAWAAGFAPVLRRVDALNQVWVQRFERDETGGQVPAGETGRSS